MATERPSEYQRSYPVAPVIPVPGTMVLIDDICRPGNGIECYIPNVPRVILPAQAWRSARMAPASGPDVLQATNDYARPGSAQPYRRPAWQPQSGFADGYVLGLFVLRFRDADLQDAVLVGRGDVSLGHALR